MAGLTPKQESFALAYIETGNASEAYRRAYEAGGMKAEAIAVEASRLLAHPKVALRVAGLQGEHAERHAMTIDDLVSMLFADRQFARDMETPGAAVTATMGVAKLLGFLTEKVEHSGHIAYSKVAREVIDPQHPNG